MPYQLVHGSGDTTRVHDGHVLGADSPLEFTDGSVTVKSEDVARDLARRHSVVEYEHVPEGRNPEGSDAEDGEEEPTCGVNGCKRTVDSPSDVCWQHQED